MTRNALKTPAHCPAIVSVLRYKGANLRIKKTYEEINSHLVAFVYFL